MIKRNIEAKQKAPQRGLFVNPAQSSTRREMPVRSNNYYGPVNDSPSSGKFLIRYPCVQSEPLPSA